MVSSSRPSSPRKTQASTPRRASTPAMIGAIRGSATADRLGGRLDRVGQRAEEVERRRRCPSSRRGTAACRSAGWKTAAKQNVMPTCSASRPTRSGGRSSRIPSASSTSAEPAWLRGRAVAVLDDAGPGAGGHDRGHRGDVDASWSGRRRCRRRRAARPRDRRAGWRRRTSRRARPVTSSIVSPLARSATAKPGDLGRCRVAGEDLAHRPGGLVRRQVVPLRRGRPGPRPSEVGRHDGQRVGGHSAAAADRSTASASRIGSIGCGTTASARDQVASQASCGRPVSTRIGGQR